MKNINFYISGLIFIGTMACAGSNGGPVSGGISELSRGPTAGAGNNLAAPMQEGGAPSTQFDPTNCWLFDEKGNPITIEECLKRNSEEHAKQAAKAEADQLEQALLEPKTLEECKEKSHFLGKTNDKLQNIYPSADTPDTPIIKLPPDYNKCLQGWNKQVELYQTLTSPSATTSTAQEEAKK